MRENSQSHRISIHPASKPRPGSYSTSKPGATFGTSSTQPSSPNLTIKPKKSMSKPVEFVFFKDIIKEEKEGPSFCEIHDDPFVSYCMTCKLPMCVKCLLSHAKKYELHQVKSLHELRNTLGSNIGSFYFFGNC